MGSLVAQLLIAPLTNDREMKAGRGGSKRAGSEVGHVRHKGEGGW